MKKNKTYLNLTKKKLATLKKHFEKSISWTVERIKRYRFSDFKSWAIKSRKKILHGVIAFFVLLFFVFSMLVYQHTLMANTNFEESEKEIFIPTGAYFSQVLDSLSSILDDKEIFSRTAHFKEYDQNVKSGRYIIKKGMNTLSIIHTLQTKNAPVKVIFHNMETPQELAKTVSKHIEADADELFETITDKSFITEGGFNSDNFLAMYIPNTYEFFWNTDGVQFRKRMLREYKRFWNESRKNRAKKLKMSEIEVLTLASIVHKESVKVDERPKIAGVYMNRLRKKMLLQADPTVIYAIKHTKNDFSIKIRRVLYKDLKIKSPYNTYINKGLPPGPIITPDISAIDAVLNYEKHDYIYFVADIDRYGYHKFAKNLKQHNKNKIQFIKWLKKKKIKR